MGLCQGIYTAKVVLWSKTRTDEMDWTKENGDKLLFIEWGGQPISYPCGSFRLVKATETLEEIEEQCIDGYAVIQISGKMVEEGGGFKTYGTERCPDRERNPPSHHNTLSPRNRTRKKSSSTANALVIRSPIT